MPKVSVDIFGFILLVSVCSLLRSFIGLNFPTGDLEFYVSDGVSQLSRFRLDKNILFSPLHFFELVDTRVFILSFAMGFFATCCAVMLSEDKRLSISSAFLLIFSFYLAQIDMHLVRQQISIYLYLIAISLRNNFFRITILSLSFIYHEVMLMFFASHGLFYLLRSHFIFSQYQLLIAGSLFLGVVSFAITGFVGILFSSVLILLFYFFKKRSRYIDFFSPSLIFISSAYFLYMLDLIYLVNLERLVGVHVSMMFIFLVCHGKFQVSQKLFKGYLVGMFFSLYFIFWTLSIT